MTVGQLIEELKTYDPNNEVVVVGTSWFGSTDPETYTSEPFITEEPGKVVIQT